MRRISWVCLLAICVPTCLTQSHIYAQIINENNACTWGISNDALSIPADSIISDAVLTLHNVRSSGDPQAVLYVQLLDNPNPDLEEIIDAQQDNLFKGYGTPVAKIDGSTLSTTSQDITLSLNQINDTTAWVWDIFDAPVIVNFGDSTSRQLSSSILALLDYAGTGHSFGFGLDCENVLVDAMSLELTIQSTVLATSETRSFNIGTMNNSPLLNIIEDKTIDPLSTLSFVISAVDADGDQVTYSATNLPEGAILIGSLFTWTPSASQAGTYSITFMAEDGNGGTDSITVRITVTAPANTEWKTLIYDDFESGWGNYTDGGSDCYLYTRSKYAPQGSNAADIQNGSGDASSFVLTNGIDLASPGYSEIELSFSYKAISMDNSSEGFRLDYWDGSKWIALKSWRAFTDFSNFTIYTETVNVSKSEVAFPVDMKIRFVCEASNILDDVMIDEIQIAAR